MKSLFKHKIFLKILKVLLAGGTIAYIGYKIFFASDFGLFFENLLGAGIIFWVLMLVALAGVALNWTFEIFKWKALYGKVNQISFADAAKGVLSGCTISAWMPNRTGDYLGRILFIPGNHYGKAIVSSVFGNMTQLLVTVLGGFGGLFYYFFYTQGAQFPLWTAIFPLVILMVLIFFCAFPARVVGLLPERIMGYSTRKYVGVLAHFSLSDRLYVTGMSMSRYIVFSLQYVLLLWAFQVDITIGAALAMVSLVFLVQSVIPSFALTEAGVRGAASIYFIGLLAANEPGILMASYTLWALNLVIPASAGAYFIMKEGALAGRELALPFNGLQVFSKAR